MDVVSDLSALLKEKEAEVVRLRQQLSGERSAHKESRRLLRNAKALSLRLEASSCQLAVDLEASKCETESLKHELLLEKKMRLKYVVESQRELDRARLSNATLQGELNQIEQELSGFVTRASVLESADELVKAAQYRAVKLYDRCCRLQQQLNYQDTSFLKA